MVKRVEMEMVEKVRDGDGADGGNGSSSSGDSGTGDGRRGMVV
jgi:hypothetical protein